MQAHPTSDNTSRTRNYLAAMERGVTGEALAAFFAPEVIQREFPNLLVPEGREHDLASILAAAERGQSAVRDQRYKIVNLVECGACVAVEIEWSGSLNVGFGSLAPGDTIHANYALFLTFSGEKIVSMNNYDCFSPLRSARTAP